MPLDRYGVLIGRPIDRRFGTGPNPHYQVHIVDDEADYRLALNVKSKLSPSELLYLVDENFHHPVTDGLSELPRGYTELERRPGGLACDYIRANLFDPRSPVPLPYDVPGPDNDLNEKLDRLIQRAMGEEGALICAFGERWGPEHHKKDTYFGFKPGNGAHNIHMNQGNAAQFARDNGVWQDGALFIHFPSTNQWIGLFLAFQSQCGHTDDETGEAIECAVWPMPRAPMPAAAPNAPTVRIGAALVNPFDADPGHETVTLLNVSDQRVDLSGWSLADKNKKKERLGPRVLGAGDSARVRLSGQGAQLSNKGGIISLLDPAGLKVHGVSYTKRQAQKPGWSLHF